MVDWSLEAATQCNELGSCHYLLQGAVEFQKLLALKTCPLHISKLRFSPTSEPVHSNLGPPAPTALSDCTYICVLRHMTIHQLTYHAKYVMKMESP